MELNNINTNTLFMSETEYSADSVEWCPHKPNQNIFVCANYHLVKTEGSPVSDSSSKRLGKLLLFSIRPETGLELLQSIDTSAILDQKWCNKQINDTSVLSVCTAEKGINIYKLNSEILKLELIASCKVDDEETDTLVLSLDWSTGLKDSDKPEIVCSDSKGHIHLLEFNGTKLTLNQSWHGHEYEAWIAGFYYWDTNIFFSGGDDSIFLKFDRRVNEAISKNRSHEAGVTSFHSNPSKEYIVASGSYDERIRLWDIRKMKTELYCIKMPGGLWRLKWDPFTHTKLLAACMLGGVHIVDTIRDEPEIIGSYYEHKNIAYGADWSYLDKEKCDEYEGLGENIIGSCSFYDRLLCVSKLCLKNK